MWCIPKVDSEYVTRMEDVLDLYAQPPDPKRPVDFAKHMKELVDADYPDAESIRVVLDKLNTHTAAPALCC